MSQTIVLPINAKPKIKNFTANLKEYRCPLFIGPKHLAAKSSNALNTNNSFVRYAGNHHGKRDRRVWKMGVHRFSPCLNLASD